MDKRANLSPAQLALLEKRIKGKAGAMPAFTKPKNTGIPRRPEGEVPLSYSQERFWVMDQLEPGNSAYNIPLAVTITGNLDLDILTDSINDIISRHEALRTTFDIAGGKPAVQIKDQLTITLQTEDIRHLPSSERSDELQRLAEAEMDRPFDLRQGPLVRATTIRKGDDEYFLLIILHHIIADGWSLGVLIREFSALYAAKSQGLPSPLAPLQIQYSDFAHWQKTPEQQQALDKQLDYWKQQLSGTLEPLNLPTDRPRPGNQTFNGAAVQFLLPPSFKESLQTLSVDTGATLFMTLIAAFQTFLARYTGQTDILLGTPIANRNREELEGLVGVFINSLVIRSQIEGGLTFRELLQNVRRTTLDAFAHQDMPFEKLVEELQTERNPAYSPLFQVMFILQNAPSASFTMQGLTMRSELPELRAAQFDITLSFFETEQGLLGHWEYNTDLFDEATVQRMAAHFQTLLAGVAHNPDQYLHLLPLLQDEEQQMMLGDWNDTAATSPDACIHQLFEAQVERIPDATALVFEEEEVTFRELNNRANHVTQFLQALGVGPDDRVGIYMERSAELVTALLATHKAGGAYLPLDPSYPQERLAFMIADAKPKVILTQANLAQQLPLHEAQVLTLTGEEPSVFLPNPTSLVQPDNLAYIIYTSGSTGLPKGVMVEHRNAVHFFTGMDESVSCGAEDAILAVTSIGFDISVLELFWTLTRGAKIVLLSEQEIIEAGVSKTEHSLRHQLQRHNVTILQGTPSLLTMITATSEGVAALKPLQKILLGGEAMPLALARLLKQHTDARLFNAYGPTEATVYATVYEVKDTGLSTIPLGRPIANYTLYILDQHLQPVPVGVAGELHIGGAGVTRGYLGREELTAERFIQNPFGAGRLYKTGDLASYEHDGTVKFLGRLDHQVKVRGYRIELGEIETRLAEHEAIREAVVIARDNILIAYVVTEGEEVPEANVLRDFLRENLPDYMVPSAIVHLDALPLTPNGKVDRKALPAPEGGTGAATEQLFVPPSTPLELALTAIWSDVLQVEKVGTQDNFFALGGHSLLATQLVARVITDLGLTVTLRDVFNKPTVRDMALFLRSAAEEQSASILPGTRDRERLASYSQERLWFLEQLEPGNAAYNVPEILRVAGRLDLERLERAMQEIFRRHDVLRTSFADQDGRAVQVVESAETFRFALPVTDLTHLPPAEREAEGQKMAAEFTNMPFELSQGPLMRFHVVKLGDEEHIVTTVFHHIITDGWSMGVFFQELQALYEGAELPELSIQFSDYALWQRDWLEKESLHTQLNYWQEKLQGDLPVLQLPTDRPRPQVQTHNGSRLDLLLPRELSLRIHALSRKEGVTSFMTLLAAYNTLLHLYSGQNDIAVGSPIANRQKTELEGLIGFFVNTLVLHTVFTADTTFRDLLHQVRQTALDAYAHQDVPFEKLVEKLAPKRSLSHSPIFQTMFVLQNMPQNGLGEGSAGLAISQVNVEKNAAQFDLQLMMVDTPDGIMGQIEYNTDLFDELTIARMAEHFHTLLEHIVSKPTAKLAHLHPFTDDEAERLSAMRALNLPKAEERPQLQQPFTEPGTPTETRLAAIWSELLGVEKVSIHDNFFDIGGHSLLATQLVAKMQKEFQVSLNIRDLFEKTTIAELAMVVEAAETVEAPVYKKLERVGSRKKR